MGTTQSLLKRVVLEALETVETQPLQRLALRLASSPHQVSCALTGAHRATYVEDALGHNQNVINMSRSVASRQCLETWVASRAIDESWLAKKSLCDPLCRVHDFASSCSGGHNENCEIIQIYVQLSCASFRISTCTGVTLTTAARLRSALVAELT